VTLVEFSEEEEGGRATGEMTVKERQKARSEKKDKTEFSLSYVGQKFLGTQSRIIHMQ